MAELVANQIANNSIKVTYQIEDTKKLGYADILYMNLNTSKIEKLTWKPLYSLKTMFNNMIDYYWNKKNE